jgi:hypothetical protein
MLSSAPALRTISLDCQRIAPPADRERKRAQQHEIEERQQRPRLDVSDPFAKSLPAFPESAYCRSWFHYYVTVLPDCFQLTSYGSWDELDRFSFTLSKIVFHLLIFLQGVE